MGIRGKNNILFCLLSENFHFFGAKIFIILNGRVFVMYAPLPCRFEFSWEHNDAVMREWLAVTSHPSSCGGFTEGIFQSQNNWKLPGLWFKQYLQV